MPIIVEDGTGITDANSYASVAFADAYFTDFANAAWAALTQPAKESALMQASQYIDLVWSRVYPGTKYRETQGLGWPRLVCCKDTDPTFPLALQKACAEYAVRASAGPLAPDPSYDDTGRQASLVREKVGPIEEERRWTSSTGVIQPTLFRPYPVPDGMMRSFLPVSGFAGGRVIR